MRLSIVAATTALTLFHAPVYALVVAPTNVTGTSTVPVLSSSFGSLDTAFNFGGVGLTRDGILFQGVTSPGGNPISISNAPFTAEMSCGCAVGGLFNASFGSDSLFETEIFATALSQTLSISGLDENRDYLFQFLHGDTRTGSFNNFDNFVTFTDNSGNSAQTRLVFGTAGTSVGAPYAVIPVLVSGATSLTYFMSNDGIPRGSSMSGLVIQSKSSAVPGPLPLLGVGAAFGFSRKLRRRISGRAS